MPEDRRLAAIMFTDIVGYTALMGSDEDKAFEVLKKNHAIHENLINKYNGTLIKEIGDGTLASFPLASDAVRCAMEIQAEAKDQDIPLKIGIHQGEMVMAGADVLGDGVNIASRLQEASKEGCITISGKVYSDIHNKAGIKAKYIGEKKLKNVADPVKVYEVLCEEEETKPAEGQDVKSKFKTLYYIIAGIIIVLGGIIIWQLLPTKEKSPTISEEVDKSIAVLPFRNDSPDQENEYFCNGMMEDILTNLQKVGDLTVRSRTSVEQYRNADKNVNEIASELNVAFIVEGSVQKVGDNIKITAQLINANSDEHLWAETYAGKYTDEIFAFQSEVAKKVASSLQAIITPVEEEKIDQKPTTEIIAYDFLKRGVNLVTKFQETGNIKYLEQALSIFDKAITIDPNYESAYWGKGHAFAMNNQFDSALFYAEKIFDLNPEAETGYFLKGQVYDRMGKTDLAIEYFSRSIDLGGNHPWAEFTIGLNYCIIKNDYVRGLPYMVKAIHNGGGGTEMYNLIGWTLLHLGDYKRAIKYFKASMDKRPACTGNIWGYSWTLAIQGKFKESMQFTDSMCAVIECKFECERLRLRVHTYLSEYGQAEMAYNQFVEAGGSPDIEDSVYISLVYKKLGKEREAISILENIRSSLEPKLTDDSPLSMSLYYLRGLYYNIASVNSMLGNKEKALQYLSKAVAIGLNMGTHDFLEIDPTFENLRNDPEFKSIVKRAQDEKAAIRAQIKVMEERGEIDL